MSEDDNYFDFGDEKPTEKPKEETKVVKTEVITPEVFKPPVKPEVVEPKTENEESKEKKISKPRKPKEPKEPKESTTSIVPIPVNTEMDNRIKQLESKITEMEKKSSDSFENKIKELNAEHQKLEAQMKLMTSFESMVKNLKPNNTLTYYDTNAVIQWIKKVLNLNLDDNELRSFKKLQKLPNWDTYTNDQKEMIKVLVRCLKDGRSFERFNTIQLKMNEDKTH